MSIIKKLTSSSILILSTCTICSCALVTVPVKVAGKAVTTTIGTAGKVAGAGVDIVTPNSKEKEDESE